MPSLPDELLVEIGRVAAHAAELDMVMAAIWAVTTGAALEQMDEVPWIVKIAGWPFPRLRARVAEEVAVWADDLGASVLGWLARAAGLMTERNQIVHALWLGEYADGVVVQHGWHGRSEPSVTDDPAVWRDLAIRLGGCGAAGWELRRSIDARLAGTASREQR